MTRTRQETDKATIDVEAQDDGILAKIIVRPLVFVFSRPVPSSCTRQMMVARVSQLVPSLLSLVKKAMISPLPAN